MVVASGLIVHEMYRNANFCPWQNLFEKITVVTYNCKKSQATNDLAYFSP